MVEHNFLRRFSEWASELSHESVPESVLEQARLQLANILAAGFAGENSESGKIGDRLIEQTEHGNSSVIGGRKRNPQTALFLNTTYSMLHDYDDYLFMGHTGHSAVFASIIATEMDQAGGDRILEGLLIANELEGRLGASVALGPHNGQMWSFIHQAGTAAVVTAVLGGDPEEIYNAVSMSLYNFPHPGDAGFMSGDGKDLTASSPSVSGFQCAMMALSGAQAGHDGLQGDRGLLERYPYVPMQEMLDGLGEVWVTESLCFKPRPGCAYIQSPLEALQQVLEQESISSDEIDKIDVRASLLSVVMESLSERYRDGRSLSPTNLTFSVPYSIALTLLEEEFNTESINWKNIRENRDRLDKYAAKVRLKHGWNHTLNTIQGLQQGVDFAPLVRKKGYFEVGSGLVKMRRKHPDVSLFNEMVNLFLTGAVDRLGESISSPLGWDQFALGKAQFDQLRLDFGATVRVRTKSSGAFTRTVKRHPGSTGEKEGPVESVVYEKLESESSKYYDSSSRFETLKEIIENLEDRQAEDLTNAIL